MAYVVEKAGLHYAVIYEGVNRITGKERRRWHRCSESADAKALACRLGAQRPRARFAGSSMSLSDYLLGRWLPAQEAALSPTTYARYVSSLTHYLLPHLGDLQLRQLHADQLGALYRRLAVDASRTGDPLTAKDPQPAPARSRRPRLGRRQRAPPRQSSCQCAPARSSQALFGEASGAAPHRRLTGARIVVHLDPTTRSPHLDPSTRPPRLTPPAPPRRGIRGRDDRRAGRPGRSSCDPERRSDARGDISSSGEVSGVGRL